MRSRQRLHGEGGFTLVELMIVIFLLSVTGYTFYSVMFSGVNGAETTRSVVRNAEEARMGLNRLVRDTRQAKTLTLPVTSTQYTVLIDFNRDGDTTDAGETETFTYRPAEDDITITVDGATEILIDGVESSGDLFDYSTNLLEYDQDGDGTAEWEEVDDPPAGVSGGDRSGSITSQELPLLTNVIYRFSVTSGEGDNEQSESFFGQAQLRNLR